MHSRSWIPQDPNLCELEGPYECPYCGYHIMLDATFLDQVEEEAICPGCQNKSHVPEFPHTL